MAEPLDRRAIWARQKEGPWAEALANIAGVLEAELEGMGIPKRKQLKHAAGMAITELLTTWRPKELQAGRSVLDSLAKWMATLPDSELLHVCWELLAFAKKHGGDFDECTLPVYAVRRMGRLTGALELESLELALALADEAENMYWWPPTRWALADWERDSQPYFRALEHESYVVQVVAAKAVGRMHSKLRKRDSRELMEWFGNREATSPGVTGAFFQGAEWGFGDGPLAALDQGFVRTWFLEVLRRGATEPFVPHAQTLEFYAHEHFCHDAEAIRDMLCMGRKQLALMTATEDPRAVGLLRELLQEMAQSDDPEIAGPTQIYLQNPQHHAGCSPTDA